MKKMTNLHYLCLGLGLGIFICSFGFWQWQKKEQSFNIIPAEGQIQLVNEQTSGELKEVVQESEEEIVVHIAGAVLKPGLVRIKKELRLGEALISVGGAKEDADLDRLNLALVLQDGCRYYVPSYTEDDLTVVNLDDGKVDINQADLSQLMTLSQIGETRARAIINYRDKQGKFQAIEDLMNVPGIAEGIFSAIKDQIKVR